MILESFSNVQFVLFSTIWLDLIEVCTLDTAVCSTTFRVQFLEAFATQTSIFRAATENDLLQSSCIEWLNLRHLSVRELSLNAWNPEYFGENRTASALKFVEVLTCTKELLVTDSQFIQLFQIIRATLRKLVISGSDYITSKSFRIALSKCEQLTEISLEDCSQIDGACVETITKKCPQLTSFSLKGCDLVDAVPLVKLITQCEQLKTIRIEQENMKDIVTQAIIERCKFIETIELREQSNLDDAFFANLIFPNTLKYVDFSYSGIDEPTMYKILSECPLLDTLILCHLDATPDLFSDTYAYKKNVNLTHLNITSAGLIDDAGCLNIGKCFPNLTHLNMDGIIYSGAEHGLLHLSNHLSKLVFLSIASSSRLVPNSEHMIQLLNRNPNLTAIELNGFSNAKVVKAIAMSPRRSKILTRLVICSCVGIDDSVIKILAANCHELTHLDLSFTDITDVSMTYLASGCKELVSLRINDMKQMTNRGYIECLTTFKKLTKVDLLLK